MRCTQSPHFLEQAITGEGSNKMSLSIWSCFSILGPNQIIVQLQPYDMS
jgi:hypothetical protein